MRDPRLPPAVPEASQPSSEPPHEALERDFRDASRRGDLNAIRNLLERASEFNLDAVDKDEWSGLLNASFFGHERVVRILLEDGRADPNLIDLSGKTALDIACENNWIHVVEILVGFDSVGLGSGRVRGSEAVRRIVERAREERIEKGMAVEVPTRTTQSGHADDAVLGVDGVHGANGHGVNGAATNGTTNGINGHH